MKTGHPATHDLGKALVLAAALAACARRAGPSPEEAPAKGQVSVAVTVEATATYAGSKACEGCHAEQARAYRGSDHDRAMEVPSPASVRAPFDGGAHREDGVVTTFRREDGGAYVVETKGPGPQRGRFPVAFTFGHWPLQQYLLEAGGGRLQALDVAWNARPAAAGGQRFFRLRAEEHARPGDALHWTGYLGSWAHLCADCHSTAFTKSYDATTDQLAATWGDVAVGCEACHGPGSRHLAWVAGGASAAEPRRGLLVSLRNGSIWSRAPGAPNATPQKERDAGEIETCAPCHSRRLQLAEGRTPDQPWLDAYRPELLSEGLYFADGQIQDEVYEYGSFVQSRMHEAGVRCSDCHDPHSTRLRAEGNALCGRCHDGAVYDGPPHHHHASGTAAAECVTCHMPARTYMVVDARRDHSLRVPRPDLAIALGLPDACTACHQERGAAWAADHVAQWFGPRRRPHFAEALHAGRSGDARAEKLLVELARNTAAPAIARGTALALLEEQGSAARSTALRAGVADGDPLVRLGAIYGARGLPLQARYEVLRPLLENAPRAVRVEAARALAAVPIERLPSEEARALAVALDELVATEKLHTDVPEGWLRIAIVERDRGRLDAAEKALREALRRDPRFVPALLNLADLARARGDEVASETALRQALVVSPTDADVLHSLGLLLVRTAHLEAALGPLARAADLRPDDAAFALASALSCAEVGRTKEARARLEHALVRHPQDEALRQALVSLSRAPPRH